MKYSNSINNILEKRNYSLYDLALDLHVSETSMWKYRKGYYLSDIMVQKIESGLKSMLDNV